MITFNGVPVKAIVVKTSEQADHLIETGYIKDRGEYLKVKVLLEDGSWVKITLKSELVYMGDELPAQSNTFLLQPPKKNREFYALIRAGNEYKRSHLKGGL